MPKITVDGKSVEAKDKQMILQACLDDGLQLPYYCYHPGLSIVASCRICLVEVEGIPKLVPSCQTPVRDGMVVHTKSPKAVANQKQVMEYLLINHPLDCPVCDQAGECLLQDYSYQFGRSQSRFEEDKHKKAKKDVGLNILLYNDRCIMCTRCVRFTREVTGTCELYVDGRGHKEEIDIFPGKPLDNPLSANVADICPVGALLDKDFLFKQRVWLLKQTPSISPIDAGGENIWIEHNEGVVYRVKPRYNADVNTWWITDDTRYSYKVISDPKRLVRPIRTQYGAQVETKYDTAVNDAVAGLKAAAAEGAGSVAAVLSPMMTIEEAWLLATGVRSIDPQAVLAIGPTPTAGADQVFKHHLTGKETFRIQAEKVPNAAGVRRVINLLGGPSATWDDLVAATSDNVKKLKAAWIVGGYLSNWIPTDAKAQPAIFKKGFRVVQDTLPNDLTAKADVVLPTAFWAETEGTWENHAGKLQAFMAAVPAPDGVRRAGDVYASILGRTAKYSAEAVRGEIGGDLAAVTLPSERTEEPAYEFVDL
ncbi:MAG: 2Fe-2S iron-sulfur cluster-binding protein [Phycisphaerae bacterium]